MLTKSIYFYPKKISKFMRSEKLVHSNANKIGNKFASVDCVNQLKVITLPEAKDKKCHIMIFTSIFLCVLLKKKLIIVVLQYY